MHGEVTIIKREAELIDGEWVAGEIKEISDPIRNTICPAWWFNMYSITDNGTNSILIGTMAVTEAQYKGALVAKLTTSEGWIIGSVANTGTYTAKVGAVDPFFEIQTTINPPASVTRNIRTIAFGSDGAAALAVIPLSASCPQTISEILQINYKIILDLTTGLTEGAIGERALNEYLRETVVVTAANSLDNGLYLTREFKTLDYDSTTWGNGVCERQAGSPIGTGSGTEIYYTLSASGSLERPQSIKRANVIAQFGKSNSPTSNDYQTGDTIKAIGMGSDGTIVQIADVSRGTASAIQNTYGRTADDATARAPFLDNNIIATSAASMNLQDIGDWTSYNEDGTRMPYLYRITMETGGLVGTATYKVRRRKFCRWFANDPQWVALGISMPTMGGWDQADVYALGTSTQADTNTDDVRHGQQIHRTSTVRDRTDGGAALLAQRYMYPEVVTWNYTGLTITDVAANYVNIDTNSTPALTVTEVLQIAMDGSDILVADAGTGLHYVQRDIGDMTNTTLAVTQLSPPGITDATSCRGVTAKGRPGDFGPVEKIRVVRGGSNHVAADTVTITGTNGSGATAEVGTVDGDGAITSVTVTARGSGYMEDNIQIYVSSGSGTGAKLEPEIMCADGDWWALFDDVTDTTMYLGHATRITSDHTNLDFQTGGDTITRSGGASNFEAEGYRPNQKLFIKDAEDAGNNGVFTITAVTTTVITVSENLTTNATDTTAILRGVNWEVMRPTITTTETLAYANNGASPDTITGTGTSFITQGFVEGMKIVISVSTSNDGIYTIAGVTATVITLDQADSLTTEGPNSDTMAALTDFTILNYTSGTPGRVGFIGLVMDPHHADDRFVMLTPTIKVANDGAASQLTAGFDWWSFANSTGTTVAGVTDRLRTASTTNATVLAGEQVATLTMVPVETDNSWITNESGDVDDGIWYDWRATANTSYTSGEGNRGRVGVLKNRDIPPVDTIVTQGTTNRVIRTVKDRTEVGITLFDTILQDSVTGATQAETMGGPTLTDAYCYMGKGIFLGYQTSTITSKGPGGFQIWTHNGDGKLTTEAAMPYGFWEEFGWDGTRWVLDNASAKTTHAASTFTGTELTFTAATGTIVGGGTWTAGDWATDGFGVGDHITVAASEDAANNGVYTIEQLSTVTLTVTPDRLPGIDTVAAPDTTATVTGSTALIDGLSLEFDDNGATDALVVGEYYDTHVYDGIIKDNATTATFDVDFFINATDSGTDYSSATVPAAPGAVTNRNFAVVNHGNFAVSGHYYYQPGAAMGSSSSSANQVGMGEQQMAGDFQMRFRVAGASTLSDCYVGIIPWSEVITGNTLQSALNLDETITFVYDKTGFPLIDQYDMEFRLTGTGAVQSTYSADRVMLDVAQDYLNFDNTGSNGDWATGSGHANNDILTMDDGSTITVLTHSGGQILTWEITTQATASSGRTERIITDDSANLDFLDGGGGADTITGDGTSFLTLGFAPGMKIWVRGANTASNNGNYTIAGVTATVITLITTDVLATDSTDAGAVMSTAITQSSSDGSGIDFAFTLGTNNEVISDLANDEFYIDRTGVSSGNITAGINGVEVYSWSSTQTLDVSPACHWNTSSGGGATVYDWVVDYTDNRRTVTVGNGTTTGASSINFHVLPYLQADRGITVNVDGVAMTLLTDGYTSPATGEVNICMGSGRIVFHDDQAGGTITGTWITTKVINLT